ncbi:hypothetical protein IAT38_001682 [Cryptococcus sp. DSM 104549]
MSLAATPTWANLAKDAATTTLSASAKALKAKVAAEKAHQLAIDKDMPRNMWIGVAGLVAICWIFTAPRFFARVAASFRKGSQERRVAGGGDFERGWFLNKGSKNSDAHAESSASSTDGSSSTAGPQPTLQPPTHTRPILFYLPFSSHFIYYAPFTRFPGELKSFVAMYQLFFLALFVFMTFFLLGWNSNLYPVTKTSGYGADYKRSGYVAISMFPLITALGVRGNMLGLCVGKGYDRLKIYHKMVGRVMVLATIWHVVAYLIKWVNQGVFYKNSKKTYAIYGYVAFGCFFIIATTSIPWARSKYYTLFKMAHIFGFIGMIVGLGWHVTSDIAIPTCASVIIIYGIHWITSWTKTRFATAELVAYPGAEATTVTLPALRSGWRAGQHVRIRVPGLGFPHGLEAHPFTIASAPDSETGAVLMCKNAGDWTSHLFAFASNVNGEPEAQGLSKKTTVIVEGPWGGLGNLMLPSFSSVFLIAGGSGITHALALAHDLINRAPSGAVRARTVDLVWMVRTEDAAKPFMPTLISLVREAKHWEQRCLESSKNGAQVQPTAFRVQIHVTRNAHSATLNSAAPVEDLVNQIPNSEKSTPGPTRLPSASSLFPGQFSSVEFSAAEAPEDKEKLSYLAANPASTLDPNTAMSSISVRPDRPDVGLLMNGIVDETIGRLALTGDKPCGVVITACGPNELLQDVVTAGYKVDSKKRKTVGGVEVELEKFGF